MYWYGRTLSGQRTCPSHAADPLGSDLAAKGWLVVVAMAINFLIGFVVCTQRVEMVSVDRMDHQPLDVLI
jgi:hypothetical protein